MSEVQHLAFESEGQVYEITTVSTADPESEYESYGLASDAIPQFERTRLLIRDCAAQVVGAFRDLGLADVQEVSLKFGVKLGGKMGVPYITEGSAESNLEVSVKCSFPPRKVEKEEIDSSTVQQTAT